MTEPIKYPELCPKTLRWAAKYILDNGSAGDEYIKDYMRGMYYSLHTKAKEIDMIKTQHDSDCSLHNEPAFPKGNCDCSVKRQSFESVTKPVIEWLNENGHPHMSVIIDTTSAELLEGQMSVVTSEFVKG